MITALLVPKRRSVIVDVPLTFPFYSCVADDDFCKILDFIERHKYIATLDATNKRSINACTTNGYRVTVNFHGEAVLMKPKDKDDSFESIESLTQRVQKIDVKTPKIEKKRISGSRRSTRSLCSN